MAFNAPHILRVLKNAQLIRKDYDAALAAGEILDVPKVPTARPGEAAKYAGQFPGDSARADTVATIEALDQAVGRILDKLKQTGLDRHIRSCRHPRLRDYFFIVFTIKLTL